jgi:superfamily I DNA/RNA helicase
LPRQSIYGFRGASVSNIDDFKSTFNSSVINLSKNFRSDKCIIDVANALTANTSYEKMVSNSTKTGIVNLLDFLTEDEEILYLINSIEKLTND